MSPDFLGHLSLDIYSHLVLLLKLCIICVIHFVIVFCHFILLSSPLVSDVSLLPCVSRYL